MIHAIKLSDHQNHRETNFQAIQDFEDFLDLQNLENIYPNNRKII